MNDEENGATRKQRRSSRQPLAQLSVDPENIQRPCVPAVGIRPSSIGELAHERDWIYPVPPNKKDYGQVLDEDGKLDEDWDARRKQLMQDLSYSMDVTEADSIIDLEGTELPPECHNILDALDF